MNVDWVPLASMLLTAHEAGIGLLGCLSTRTIRPINEVVPSTLPAGPVPGVSVIVTAKDEARDIESTVTHFLAQSHLPLEVIVVNDRSIDNTGTILDRLASVDSGKKLTVIHNAILPEGWLGKSHACQLGTQAARHPWILFTDGDVRLLQNDFLVRVVAYCEQNSIDHLALINDMRPMGVIKEAMVTVFGKMYSFGTMAHEQNADRRRGGGGIGAFNLVRRSAYDRIGGHAAFPLDTGDDFKLGRLMKRSGFRQRLWHGFGSVHCRWHDGAVDVIRGLEKNFFGGFNYSVTKLSAFTVGLLITAFGPLILAALVLSGAIESPSNALAWALLPLVTQLGGSYLEWGLYGRRVGIRWFTPMTQLVGSMLVLVAGWNSAIRILKRGGVAWRDSFYSLDALRRNLIR